MTVSVRMQQFPHRFDITYKIYSVSVNVGSNDCGDNGFGLYDKCYILSESQQNFQTTKSGCDVTGGRLAPLGDDEIRTAMINYFEKKNANMDSTKFWLSVEWNSSYKKWIHSADNTTVRLISKYFPIFLPKRRHGVRNDTARK